jgi:hypothetical protein
MGGFAGCTMSSKATGIFFVKISTAMDNRPRSPNSVEVINNGNANALETIDLAEYLFSPDPFSSGFNWRSIALTLEAWNNLSDDHNSFVMTLEQDDNPDPQVLVLNYRQVDLWIIQGIRRLVVWHGPGRVLYANPDDPGVKTSTELPIGPVQLLRVLSMTADPLADEVIQLWKSLVAILPELK